MIGELIRGHAEGLKLPYYSIPAEIAAAEKRKAYSKRTFEPMRITVSDGTFGSVTKCETKEEALRVLADTIDDRVCVIDVRKRAADESGSSSKVKDVERTNFLISLVDGYIKQAYMHEQLLQFPLEINKRLFDSLPAEEQAKIPQGIIINQERLNKFLQ